MYCIRCGKDLEEGAKFCSNCGFKMADVVECDGPTETAAEETTDYSESKSRDTGFEVIRPEEPVHFESRDPPQRTELFGRTTKVVVVVAIVALVLMVAVVGGLGMSDDSGPGKTTNPDKDPIINTGYKVEVIQGNHIKSVSGGGTYYSGNVTLTAIPENGYCFWGWYDTKGNIVCTDTTYVIKAQNITLKAVAGEGTRIVLLKGAGIDTVEGDGYYSDSAPKITATVFKGEKFKGWYDVASDSIISTKSTATLPKGGTRTIVALTESSFYKGSEKLEFTPSVKYTDSIYIVTDHWTGRYVASARNVDMLSVSVEPGRYDIQVSGYNNGKIKSEETTKLVDGRFHRDYDWTYKGRSYGMWWEWNYSVVDDLHRKNVDRSPNNDSAMKGFVDSESVSKICEILTEQSTNMSSADRANFVLAFVQQVTVYEYDKDYNGVSNYFKYPVETLYDMRGDCEDTSILYCALMKHMGYEVALCDYTGDEYKGRGHMAAAVYVPSGIYGTYYDMSGKKFYYCETTSDTKRVGERWDEYNTGHIIIIT